MAESLYKIAEKCHVILRKGDMQSLISSVIDAYASVVKLAWYEGRADGCNEIAGEFLYTFGKTTPLTPVLDVDTDEYYILIPSSYLNLPHQMGIAWVSYMKDKKDFIRVANGGIWSGIKANLLGGRQTYRTEGVKMFFPKMKPANVGNILLKMAIALNTINVRENLNIPPNVQDQIISMVVAKHAPQEKPIPENLA